MYTKRSSAEKLQKKYMHAEITQFSFISIKSDNKKLHVLTNIQYTACIMHTNMNN